MTSGRLSLASRALRAPALHFLIAGVALFAMRTLTSAGDPEPRRYYARTPIVVSTAELERLRDFYVDSVGSTPDAAAYDHMIERFVEDELLYREALALGLDRGDDTIRWRLIEKMRYLGEATEEDPDDEVFERALRLGLQRKDPIVRSVLIRKYGMLVRFAHESAPLDEQRLRDYYETNKDRFADPPRVSLTHVFLSKQERGERAHDDAVALRSKIEKDGLAPAEAISLGDVFHTGHELTGQTRARLGQLFGDGFASEALELEPGAWSEPIESAFGRHLVFVSAREGGGYRTLEDVRSQVLKGAEDQRREERLRSKLADLRGDYEIDVQWGDLAVDDGA